MKKSHIIIMIVIAIAAILGLVVLRKMIAHKQASDTAAAAAQTLQNLTKAIQDQANRNTQPDYRGIPPMPAAPQA